MAAALSLADANAAHAVRSRTRAASPTLRAQPDPRPQPALRSQADPNSQADPIGALLAQQAQDNATAAMPVVIGVKLEESPGKSRLLIELSDPVDIRTFTLTSPNRVVLDLPEVLWRVAEEGRPSAKARSRAIATDSSGKASPGSSSI